MDKPDGAFIFVGTFTDEASALAGFEMVKALHHLHAISAFDVALVTRDDDGKVHIDKDGTRTRPGLWGGAAVGAVLGVLFPPSILGAALVGSAVGGVGGHFTKGLSRRDIKDLGDLLDTGSAALVVVGDSTISRALDELELNAETQIKKDVTGSIEDLETAMKA